MRAAAWVSAALLGPCLSMPGYLSVSAAHGGGGGARDLAQHSRPPEDGQGRRGLQGSSAGSTTVDLGDVVINGVLDLLTTDALEACPEACRSGIAAAFGVNEADVGCVCPNVTAVASSSSARRSLLGEEEGRPLFVFSQGFAASASSSADKASFSSRNRGLRGLAELDERAGAAFALRVSGGLDGGVEALDLLTGSGWSAVASLFGVEESELDFSTLAITPPSSEDTLNVIADYADAADVEIVPMLTASGADWAGGGKGVALFLSLLVLSVGTACCCCVGLAIAWKMKLAPPLSKKTSSGYFNNTTALAVAEPVPRPSNDSNDSNVQSNADSSPSRGQSIALLEGDSTSSSRPKSRSKSAASAVVSASAPPSASASAPYAGGEIDGGSSVRDSGVFSGASSPVATTPVRPRGSGVGAAGSSVEGGGGADVAATGEAMDGSFGSTPGPEESRGTNPLYKSVAPLSRLAAQPTPPSTIDTPGRTRLGFLGNATPARLRKLAGRLATRSPALSGGSRHSRRSSRSSSSSRKNHRRQGTFPGAYSQRNSSEMDHQRPPADPVYTFMIKTIAAKGFKFMSTTEIAFCAMRMYSHFKRTEGNYKRLAVMKHAENVPPVYEIIWLCDASAEQIAQGHSRFFSSSRGTDAEQQKSLLACLLALSWNGSASSRKTLHRALTPTKPTRIPAPEDIFWDDFKDNTDALSGDDQMVVLARVILLVAESTNRPASPDSSSDSSAAPAASAMAEENGIDHGDVMKALSGAHLREVGITIKASRPVWQEAHVQLVSVLLVIAFLEEGAKNALADRPDPLSSLEWVGILTPDALDSFLVEKLDARRALVELDLEPSGLVIKHDDDGEVERVEPALEKNKPLSNSGSWIGSRGHQRILPRSSDRKSSRSSRRAHRRSHSTETADTAGGGKKSHSPVKITTVMTRKHSQDSKAASALAGAERASKAALSSTQSQASTPSATGRGGGGSNSGGGGGLRTIAQQRSTPSSRGSVKNKTSGGSWPQQSQSQSQAQAQAPPSSSASASVPGFASPAEGLTIKTEEFSARVPATGGSVRSSLSRGLSPPGSEYQKSETSSVVTRVYAPSTCTADDQVAFSRAGGESWAMESSLGQRSPMNADMDSATASPMDGMAMSQVSISASRYVTSPSGAIGHLQRGSDSSKTDFSAYTAAASTFAGNTTAPPDAAGGDDGPREEKSDRRRGPGRQTLAAVEATHAPSQDLTGVHLEHSPTAFSEAGKSDAGYSEAASRYEAPSHFDPIEAAAAGSRAAAAGGTSRAAAARARVGGASGLGIEPPTPNSAAGSRFDGSPMSNTTAMSRIAGSPTAEGGETGPYTARSMASSMRSGNSSFFKSGSSKSGDARTRVSSASGSSWDEEDLQNMGTRWLSERAYNQQFDDAK